MMTSASLCYSLSLSLILYGRKTKEEVEWKHFTVSALERHLKEREGGKERESSM